MGSRDQTWVTSLLSNVQQARSTFMHQAVLQAHTVFLLSYFIIPEAQLKASLDLERGHAVSWCTEGFLKPALQNFTPSH